MDLREKKGMQILKAEGVRRMDNGWAVRSQSAKKHYNVSNELKCNCPDCKYNEVEFCKHAYAVKYYLQVEKPSGEVEKVRLSAPQAWSAYNKAQQSEVELFDKLLKDLVQGIEEPEYSFGRPILSRKESVFCAIQKVYSRLSSRRAKSLFNKSVKAEYLKHSPHFNAVSKLLNKESTAPLLKELIIKTALPLKSVESQFAIDSIVFTTNCFTSDCSDKHGLNKRHQYVKAHICVGVKTNVITSAIITEGNGADNIQLQELVEQTNNHFNALEYSADKAYNSINNYNLIHDSGAKAYIPFKSNITATVRSGNKGKLWRKMFHYFQLNQEEFNQHYHKRSNVETTFHMIKSKLGDSVKSKNFVAQQNELLCKLIAHNIIVLIQEIHELGIDADLSG